LFAAKLLKSSGTPEARQVLSYRLKYFAVATYSFLPVVKKEWRISAA
jgi:hypothetical protein